MFPIRDTIRPQRRPLVTWLLIFINGVAFLNELSVFEAGDPFLVQAWFAEYGLVPAHYLNFEGLTFALAFPLLTHSFVHAGWLHFIFNMWALWIYGDNVEDRMGRWSFAAFYLLCGLVAALTHVALNPGSTMPAVGASGAIAGVMGAYLFLFPRSAIITLIPLVFIPFFFKIPAYLIIGVWLLTQLIQATQTGNPAGGIAIWAHIGGFVAGVVLFRLFLRRGQPV